MSNSANGLAGAWKIVTTKVNDADLERRRAEDFRFMTVCAAKGNMAMYQLLRDRSLVDKPKC